MNEPTYPLSLHIARPSLPVRYAVGVAAVLLVSLLVFWLVLRPPLNEVGWMALFLSGTALLSIALGYAAYRAGWLQQAPTLRWSLLGGYALSSLLTFLNVWVTARLMFASPHDLLLATVLLLFASGIAMSLGLFLSTALTDRIRLVERAAQSVSRGRLDVRIEPQGKDEMARLARSFNEMTARLQAAERKQQEAEKMRRDLIAWVSHDLQTPLASVRAVIEALADGVVDDPQTSQRYLATAQKEIRELSALIDDLFQMSQLEAGGLALAYERASLSDLLSDTLESFSALAAQKQIELSGEPGPGLEAVEMDARLIGRALNNLIGNALRHTPPGGWVRVAAGKGEAGVWVEVSDSGEGIAREDLPHIFERFYRGEKSRSRATGGAGLGLAIAQGIIAAHGGEIHVESGPGMGAKFSFTLPGRKSK